MNNEEKKRRKRGRHKAYHRHTKQIADDTKQYKGRQEVYAVPRGSQFCVKNEEYKNDAEDTKQIADDTKQYKGRQEVYAVPRGSQFCKSGLGILRKGEVIP
ncbi:hypothetical protein T4A_9554 [Trichinella pseudospiralis]|uniref:Uncharacterized protein n=1 Tax=Trichinella pseudospiralis TaxID=6337 RepID=A0A0V1EE79_TRIPS|nr:hypothetical protein T4A_9554 [Trichinella pseudospiralis]